MTFFTIPITPNQPWQTFKITLSGVIYNLIMRYNNRSNRWILDIMDANNNPILRGMPVLIQRNITQQFRYLKVPAGVFFATDDTGGENQPTLYAFGITNTLFYEDPTT